MSGGYGKGSVWYFRAYSGARGCRACGMCSLRLQGTMGSERSGTCRSLEASESVPIRLE